MYAYVVSFFDIAYIYIYSNESIQVDMDTKVGRVESEKVDDMF